MGKRASYTLEAFPYPNLSLSTSFGKTLSGLVKCSKSFSTLFCQNTINMKCEKSKLNAFYNGRFSSIILLLRTYAALGVLTLLTREPDQSGSRSRLHCNRQMAPHIERIPFPLGDDCSQYIY